MIDEPDETRRTIRFGNVEELRAALAAVTERNRQLEEALITRVVIEQAKGILSERLGISVEDAFALLRMSARSDRIALRVLATRVVRERGTPQPIIRGMARETRWRAAATRERAEAVSARAIELREAVERQAERLAAQRRRMR